MQILEIIDENTETEKRALFKKNSGWKFFQI